MHTHAVIINATQRSDGEWRSLESREMYRLQKEAGMLYRVELAAKAQELGYSVEKTHKDGRFELKEVPRAVKDHFSKRSEAIEKALEGKGKTRKTATAKEKETITKATRDRKQDVDRRQLSEKWRTEARDLGFDPEKARQQALDRARDPFQAKVDRVQMARDAVRKSVSALSEREASFRKDDLIKAATARGFGKVSRGDVEQAMKRLEERKELLGREVPDRKDNQKMVAGYTTPSAVELENKLSNTVNRNKGLAPSIIDEQRASIVIQSAEQESAKQGHSWNHDQREATKGLLTCNDRIVAVQGAAGTAKTSTVLSTFAREAEKQGYQVQGMTPSASAAKQLEEGGGIKSRTIHRFLSDLKRQEIQQKKQVHINIRSAKYHQGKADNHGFKAGRGFQDGTLFRGKDGRLIQKGLDGQYHRADIFTALAHDSMQTAYKLYHAGQKILSSRKAEQYQEKAKEVQQGTPKKIWVVDEASMVGTRKMKELLDAAEKHNARVVLVGDRQQLGSVEAGRVFGQMQDLGMKTFRLDKIVRQKDEELKRAVDDAYRGRASEALDRIEKKGNVIEIVDPHEKGHGYDRESGLKMRAEAIAKEYFSQSQTDREKTIIIAPGHDDRKIINSAIRDGLQREGTVSSREASTTILQGKGLTKQEMREASSYESGNIVRFSREYQKHGIEKGSYWQVQGSDANKNTVTLQKDGKKIEWNPAKWGSGRAEVYRSEKRELAAGDKIIWTKNNRDLGVRNNETARVKEISGKSAKIELPDGKIVKVNLDDQKHWDYAYACTSYSAQGATADRALIHAESWRLNLQHQRNMYVGISRAKQEVKIFTNDKMALRESLRTRTGEKTAAMEGANKPSLEKTKEKHAGGKEKLPRMEKFGKGIDGPSLGR
jgi:ATP-dependent exoDNAse (exonuclease V) alpha subunit